MKQELVRHLREQGIEVVDAGCDSTEIVRYPHYARAVAGAVARGEADRVILICSTGIFEIFDIVDTWLAEAYIGGRHDISLGIIAEQEEAFGLTVPTS